jgi:hypothetical protein
MGAPQQVLVAGKGAAAAAVAYVAGSGSAIAASGSPQTISSHPIGTASADRYVIVVVACHSTSGNIPSISAITVGGVACTEQMTFQNTGIKNSIWITGAPVTSGTTANIVITYTDVNTFFVATYAATALLQVSIRDAASAGVNSAQSFPTIQANGFAVGSTFAKGTTNGGTFTWSNLIEDADSIISNPGGLCVASKHSAAGQSNGIVATGTEVGQGFSVVIATWR